MAGEVKHYRKKSVEVEVMQWDGSEAGRDDIIAWAGGALEACVAEGVLLALSTRQGELVRAGDYVVRGCVVSGRNGFYPLSPDCFEELYEETPDAKG